VFVKLIYLVYNDSMAIRLCVLGSGSKGNSVLVDNGKTRLLIDAGLGARDLKKRLNMAGVDLQDLDGILVTHEHIDHIRALETFSKTATVYAHNHTMQAILERGIELKLSQNFDSECFSIGSMDIETFRISHDAVYPLGYSISDNNSKITYATDMGYCSQEFLTKAQGSDIIMIESNHDLDMLLNGRYPAFLKRRIVSNVGHLSNYACAAAINELAQNGVRKFILSHLSEQNNLPELAYWTIIEYLKNKGANERDIKLYVAEQRQISCCIGCN